MKRILMLGAGFMQGVAIRCAHSRGWEVVAVDGNPDAVCASLANHFENIDLKDRDGLASFALELKKTSGLDGVFTAATDFSASVAWVARSCGLPGHSFEAACNASDKVRMRGCFERAGVPSPSFIGITELNRSRALELLQEKGIAFPLVVKPADNMGARGCRTVLSAAELSPAVIDAIRYSRTGTAIIEEFMDGPEFSLEALVYDGEIHMTGCADRHIFFPPYFIEMGHTIPSSFSDEDQQALCEVFHKGIRALGLSWGVAKGDIKLTKKGPMIGEIAGRLSGGYMSGWTFPYSSGINLTDAALGLAVGERPASLENVSHMISAERAWISIPGKIVSVSGYDKARSIPFVRDVFPRAKSGDEVNFPVNNVEKCGNCIAVAPSRDASITAAEEACRAIFLRLAVPHADTESFLAGGLRRKKAFPPDAFSIPADWDRSGFSQAEGIPSGILVPTSLISLLDRICDWQGRTLRAALLQACEIEPGLLSVLSSKDSAILQRYWAGLLRGGIQGIIYLYDKNAN